MASTVSTCVAWCVERQREEEERLDRYKKEDSLCNVVYQCIGGAMGGGRREGVVAFEYL